MSRSFKSKDAQRAHNWTKYTKAYGYVYDYAVEVPEDLYTTNQFGSYIKPLKTKRDIFEHVRWHVLKGTCHHQRKNCVVGEDKRTVNKQHRAKVRTLVKQFIHGKAEDVITTAVGPRNPMRYWS